MTITFHTGNILVAPEQVIVIPVNCVGVMGAGLALEAKRRWPAMYKAYRKACARGELKPGGWFGWPAAPRSVVCFATKDHWRDPARLEWIDAGLARYVTAARGTDASMAWPALGCGLGGLAWGDVMPVMHRRLSAYGGNVAIYLPREWR